MGLPRCSRPWRDRPRARRWPILGALFARRKVRPLRLDSAAGPGKPPPSINCLTGRRAGGYPTNQVIDVSPDEPPPGGGKADRRRALVAAAYRRIASDGFEGLRTRD